MLLLRQLELNFEYSQVGVATGDFGVVAASLGRGASNVLSRGVHGGTAPSLQRDAKFEHHARELLRLNGAERIADEVRVEWNPRLKSCAGRADYRQKLISLNPQLRIFVGAATAQTRAGELDCLKQSSLTSGAETLANKSERCSIVHDEIDRTFRHELAHLLAQFRAGRRRILPHGDEWRIACCDLGIADEKRCHNLPFAMVERARRFVYRCPSCKRDFPRVRKIRRAIACLACCRAYSHGEFDPRFRLKLISAT